MAYEKTEWKNREVERPRTFEKIENPDGTIMLAPAEGRVIEPGTPIIAENMNKIEQGIVDAHSLAQQAFQSASDGKQKIAGAITGKGVPTDPSDTFATMANNINAIETDKTGDATAVAADILSGKTAYVRGSKIIGTMPNRGSPTYNPSTSSQSLPAGYYSGGKINPVVGTASDADVLSGKTYASAAGINRAGAMPNRGAVIIQPKSSKQVLPAGYYASPSQIDGDERLIPENVRKGVRIFDKVGSLVPLTNEKKWASGTANSDSKGVVTVSYNFGFTPSIVIVVPDYADTVYQLFYWSAVSTTQYAISSKTTSRFLQILDGTHWYITANGFKLTHDPNSARFSEPQRWIAIE